MSYRFRNVLFFVFSLVFILLTLYFSLYASGYRFVWSNVLQGKSFVQKTGILVLNSSPKGARIYLSREERGPFFIKDVLKDKEIRTPSKIKNLLPGEYLLRLELEDHWSWEQKITVHPGQSTYLEGINLFKQGEPLALLSSPVQNIIIDSGFKNLILDKDKTIFNLKNEKQLDFNKSNILLNNEAIYSLEFLGSNKALVNNHLIFDYSKNDYLNPLGQDMGQISQAKIRGNNFYYLSEGDLWVYQFLSKSLNKISDDGDIINYDFFNNFYFFIKSKDGQSVLEIYSNKNKNLIKNLILPGSRDYKIINPNTNTDFIYIYDQVFDSIYVVNIASKFSSLWLSVNEVKGFSFIDSNSLIYFSDFEIYTLNSPLAEKFLLARFDSEIKSLVWHPKNYVIYSNDKGIKIIDLRHDNYLIELLPLDGPSSLALDRRGSVLYFSAKIGAEEALYKLLIR